MIHQIIRFVRTHCKDLTLLSVGAGVGAGIAALIIRQPEVRPTSPENLDEQKESDAADDVITESACVDKEDINSFISECEGFTCSETLAKNDGVTYKRLLFIAGGIIRYIDIREEDDVLEEEGILKEPYVHLFLSNRDSELKRFAYLKKNGQIGKKPEQKTRSYIDLAGRRVEITERGSRREIYQERRPEDEIYTDKQWCPNCLKAMRKTDADRWKCDECGFSIEEKAAIESNGIPSLAAALDWRVENGIDPYPKEQ